MSILKSPITVAYVDSFADELGSHIQEHAFNRKLGVEFDYFLDIDAALDALLGQKYDAIITDSYFKPGEKLPREHMDSRGGIDMNAGYVLAQRLRQEDYPNRDTPILFYTAINRDYFLRERDR